MAQAGNGVIQLLRGSRAAVKASTATMKVGQPIFETTNGLLSVATADNQTPSGAKKVCADAIKKINSDESVSRVDIYAATGPQYSQLLFECPVSSVQPSLRLTVDAANTGANGVYLGVDGLKLTDSGDTVYVNWANGETTNGLKIDIKGHDGSGSAMTSAYTFPLGKSGEVVTTSGTNTFTGTNTFSNGIIQNAGPLDFQFRNLTTGKTATIDRNKAGDLAFMSDIPSTTNFVALTGSQTVTGLKTFKEEATGAGSIELQNWSGRKARIVLSGTGSTIGAYTLPAKTGTFALTSDIGGISSSDIYMESGYLVIITS